MNTTQDFVNLFVDSTGELLYFIAIFLIYQAALLMALGQRTRSKQEQAAGRYTAALVIVELVWLALMAGALYTVIQDNSSADIFPPLERAAIGIIIVSIGWALLTAEHESEVGSSQIGAGLIVAVLGYVLVATYQNWDSAQDFNPQDYNTVWTIIPVGLAVLGIALLLTRFRDVDDIPLKLLFFVILIAGHGYTLYQISQDDLEGDAAGAARWAFLTASALVAILVYRMVIERMRQAVDEVATYAETISKPMKPIAPPATPSELSALGESVTAQTAGTASIGGRNEALELLKALGIMLDEPDTDVLPRQTVRAVASSFKADVVALMACSEDLQWATILNAYDQINEHTITGMNMNLEDQATLREALTDKKPKHLSIETHADELRDLYTRLDIGPIGPAYLQPLTQNAVIVGMLVVGFPHTHRELRPEDMRLLASIGPIAARLMVLSQRAIQQREEAEQKAIQSIVEGEIGDLAEESRAKSETLQANLEQSQIQIRELNRLVDELEDELGKERGRVQELLADGEDAMSVTQRINVLSLERQQLREERENLANALIEARASLVSVTAEDDAEVYETMIADLQQEYEDLKAKKESLQRQLEQIRETNDTLEAGTRLNEYIETLSEEKAQIAADRDMLAAQLQQTKSQLEALGIEGGVMGLARQIAQLTEERIYYKAQAERATQEREALLAERRKLEASIAEEARRDARISALEAELGRVMEDREALAKSRDNLRLEREALLAERENWRGERARMVAHNDSLKMELDETLDLLHQANETRQELASQLNELNLDRDKLRASYARTENERDALLARVEGDRERLREVGVEGVGTLTKMIDELTAERADLEKKLLETQQQLQNLKWDNIQLQGSQSELAQQGPIDAGTVRALAEELVSPSSAMSHYVDVLLGESVGALSALQQQFLTRLKSNMDRLNHLLADLVQAAGMLESGTLNLEPSQLNLVEVIDDAITASRRKFSEKGIVLDLEIADDEIQIEADHDAMRQVFSQLIDNAYIVSPNDGNVRVAASYLTEANDSNRQVLVSITDQGGGVPRNMYDVVFDRINRADNTLVPGLGHSGIELSLVKGLIEAHHGEIWIESEEGTSTTFKFRLPTTFSTATVDEG